MLLREPSVARFIFIKGESVSFPVAVLCRVLQVCRSSFYKWLKAEPSKRDVDNQKLDKEVSSVFNANKGLYGRRRVTAAVNSDGAGKAISINRVSRRMKAIGIAGYQPKAFKKTTIPNPKQKDSPNLVGDHVPKLCNQTWISDITYIRTLEGWLYLCVILDLCSRKVVGWSTRSDMTVELLLKAFNNACLSRKRDEDPTIFHSDKGGQFKAKKFRRVLKANNFLQSMTGVNHCYDNAFAESFFATLKNELIQGRVFRSRSEAESEIFKYIEVYYNRTRLHSSLGYMSPEAFEKIV